MIDYDKKKFDAYKNPGVDEAEFEKNYGYISHKSSKFDPKYAFCMDCPNEVIISYEDSLKLKRCKYCHENYCPEHYKPHIKKCKQFLKQNKLDEKVKFWKRNKQ